MPAHKKDPSVRARRNTAATAATLTKQTTKPKISTLPPHPGGKGWHPQARAFWNDVWSSPMSPEWDIGSDKHNVLLCALLMHDMWTSESAGVRAKAAGELRLQRRDLGLAPYPRRQLEWQIEQTDEAQEKGQQRRAARKAPAAKRAAKKPADPRAHLHSVPDVS